MSQAKVCLAAPKKVQSWKWDFGNGILRATYLLARAGVVLQIFPAVSDLAA